MENPLFPIPTPAIIMYNKKILQFIHLQKIVEYQKHLLW